MGQLTTAFRLAIVASMASKKSKLIDMPVLPAERIASSIYLIRGQKVMLDSDLSKLYGVLTKNLNLAVRRNARRFPTDFMFQLSEEEGDGLRLQIATAKIASTTVGRGGRRSPPFAFTEQGVAMLSSALKSERAADVNVMIMRTFVHMRQILASDQALARKIEQHDQQITLLFEHVRRLLEPPPSARKRLIGFAS